MTRIAKIAAGVSLAAAVLAPSFATAEELFKIVTVKDEIIVGLNDAELKEFGDAGGLAKAIASKGSVTLWQYAVTQGRDGERQMAPRAKVGVLANSSLRVEPYKQSFKILPHE
jgi:hypothetical protein